MFGMGQKVLSRLTWSKGLVQLGSRLYSGWEFLPSQWDRQLKFSRKNFENWRFWKMHFFWVGHFEFFFQKNFFFAFFPWKLVKVYWLARMAQNFDQAKCDNTFWPMPNILKGSVTEAWISGLLGVKSFPITNYLPFVSQQSELLGYIDPQLPTPHLKFPAQCLSLSQSPSSIWQGLVSEQHVQKLWHAENEFC